MVEFLSFTADEWSQDGVGGDSGPGCFGRLVQVLSGSGGAGGGGGGGDEIINPMGGKKTANIGDNGGKAPNSPLFVSKQVAPAENSPVPQARLLGSPDARVAPAQPPVPLAGGMYIVSCPFCTLQYLCSMHLYFHTTYHYHITYQPTFIPLKKYA